MTEMNGADMHGSFPQMGGYSFGVPIIRVIIAPHSEISEWGEEGLEESS